MSDINFDKLDINQTQSLPYHFAKRNGVIAVCREPEGIEVWVHSKTTAETLAELRRTFGENILPQQLDDETFERALSHAYQRGTHQAAQIVDDLDEDLNLSELAKQLPKPEDLLEKEDDAPIIRLLNALLTQAVREEASDIHIEPFENRSVVRFRIDGVLRDVVEPQYVLHSLIISRVKIMANLDIAEKRLPQDGRITLRLAGRPVDVRVSTLPTAHGERVVMRLLDKQAGRLELPKLGMNDTVLLQLRTLIHQPHGIVLVTGPTGSGKTTTLYAALSEIDSAQYNIMTVEDPIEYDLNGIGQTQVNSRVDLSFARTLRAILRQDPDVIMIGEIRDLETAQIAVQASLTGHLVLATLHTNDAVSAITRLVDMGIEPFLAASSLLGVLAQRLVRKLCPRCRREHMPSEAEGKLLQIQKSEKINICAPIGCDACAQTGYAGRTGVYELLNIDNGLRGLIHDRAAETKLRDYAEQQGMIPIRLDALRWVREHITSLEEALRVTRA